MRVVAFDDDVLGADRPEVLRVALDDELRERLRRARELQLRLVEVVLVEMRVAERVHEVADLQIGDVRDGQAVQGVAGRGPVGELAIAWLNAQDGVASVIAGATTPDQVRANAAAAAWRLDPADAAAAAAL